MNAFEFHRAIEKITPGVIREIGVQSVQENKDVVISDSIVANAEGLTFAGNKISEYKPFSDWEESGEFHENLKFQSTKNIEFSSSGDGFSAIESVFPYDDTIAPSAKILDESTLSAIKDDFINIIKNKMK